MNLRGPQLSSRGAIAVVLLLLGALVLAGLAAIPWFWRDSLTQQYDVARTDLRFIEARINAAKSTSRPGLAASSNVAPLFIEGATAGLGLANLQARLSADAEAAGIVIVRSQPLQTDGTAGLTTLRDEVEVTGSIEALRDFLLAVETTTPLLFVTQAQISAPPATTETAGQPPSAGLDAVLQIEGYSWREGAK